MTAPSAIADLVSRFHRNAESYRSPSYNEEQLRSEFLNPLFIALGWDVYNTSGDAEPYKDVLFEQSLKIGPATKAPDYCFRIGFSNPSDKFHHDRTVELLSRMLDLHKRKVTAKVPAERQIAATDAEIDGLVYELYGLTEEEIKIVEAQES